MSFEVKMNNGDLRIANGRIQTIRRGDKLLQQASKIMVTRLGGIFHPEYGSNLHEVVGRAHSQEVTKPLSEDEIKKTLIVYQQIQSDQEIFQEMDDEEVLFRMLKATATRITTSVYRVDIDVLDRKGNELNIPTAARI